MDGLADTLFSDEHIPLIVLVADKIKEVGNFFETTDVQIVDGLQRTTRLQALYVAVQEKIQPTDRVHEISKNILRSGPVGSEIMRQARAQIAERISSGMKPQRLFESFNREQWFEVWGGLSHEQKVKKMLLLNAGHKPVSTRHQLELLFLAWLPRINHIANEDNIRIYREKDKSSIRFSKERKTGEFHFSHLIAGLIALGRGKPVTTNSELIKDLQIEDIGTQFLYELSTEKLISALILLLNELDRIESRDLSSNESKWAGREIVIVGTLAAAGAFAKANSISLVDAVRLCAERLASTTSLCLSDFEKERNNLDLAKVNIGDVNKRAVFRAITTILKGEDSTSINWKNCFSQEASK